MGEARLVLLSMLENPAFAPTMREHIGANAVHFTVEGRVLASASSKLASGVNQLTSDEELKTLVFFPEHTRARVRPLGLDRASDSVIAEMWHVTVTTSVVERLYSRARHLLTFDRQVLSPETIQQQIFALLSTSDINVSKLVNPRREEDELLLGRLSLLGNKYIRNAKNAMFLAFPVRSIILNNFSLFKLFGAPAARPENYFK
jgi:hypothetical protein